MNSIVESQNIAKTCSIASPVSRVQADSLAEQIVGLVSRFRRLTEDAACVNQPCHHCESPHLGAAKNAIRAKLPIEFALPGFPAKSPSLRKVLGYLPDEAEHRALTFLNDLCEQIRSMYEPGAKVIICSDGRVFGDYVGIPDPHITAYQDELAVMLRRFPHLSAYNLDDKWPGATFDEMRERLTSEYAESQDAIREAVKTDPDTRRLHLGMSRFLFEDQKGRTQESNRQLQLRAKEGAIGVIQRSKAWGALVAEQFPGALRLSIHPQPCGSSKLGIRLGRTPDVWLTPWHSVAVKIGNTFQLMKRHEAEAAGARIVRVDGKNSHMTFEDGELAVGSASL
ncbi:MAG: isocyanide synthase family protein [Polyangiaceae bacterium]